MGWIEWKKISWLTNWKNSLRKANNIEKTIDQTNWEVKSVLKIKEKSFFDYLKQKLNFTETPQIASAREDLIESIRSWNYNSRAYINYDNLVKDYIFGKNWDDLPFKLDLALSFTMVFIYLSSWKIDRANEDLDNLEFFEWYSHNTLINTYIEDVRKIIFD